MHKKTLKFIGLVALNAVLMACQSAANQATYVPQKISGLKTPESVVQAKDGRIFISEIGEFDKDGDGQITMIDSTGKASVFASGLNDPKGLAIIGEHLFVADKTKVWKISPDGKANVFVPATAFTHPPFFLNDVEADPQGNLYVSDTGDLFKSGKGGAVYKISPQGALTLVINDQADARIKAPNGLLADDTGDVLIIADFTSGVLYSYNQKTKTLIDIAEGFGGGDGVVHHPNGTMFVSDWKNGKVFSVNTKGDVETIKTGYQAAADVALTKDGKYLMVPDMKAGVLDFIPVK